MGQRRQMGNATDGLGAFCLLRLLIVMACLCLGCRRSGSAPGAGQHPEPVKAHPRETWSVSSVGEVGRLHIKGQTLLFCDARGGRRVDLATEAQAASDRNCASKVDADEVPDDDVVTVSSPNMEHEPNDRVDIEGLSYWLDGRGHAWANEKTTAIVGSGLRVELIDEATDKVAVLDTHGADQVAMGGGWAAWVRFGENGIHVASVAEALAKVHERDHKQYWEYEEKTKAKHGGAS